MVSENEKSLMDKNFRKIALTIACEQDRIVRPAEAVIMTGRSLASIWRDCQAGTFVPKIRIGQNSVGFRLSDLQAWLASREVVTADNVIPVCPGAARGRKPSVKENFKMIENSNKKGEIQNGY